MTCERKSICPEKDQPMVPGSQEMYLCELLDLPGAPVPPVLGQWHCDGSGDHRPRVRTIEKMLRNIGA
jgi:hypothetical protein